jgi:hypothetical protein
MAHTSNREEMMTDPSISRTAQMVVAINLLLASGLLVSLAMVMWWQPILADEWDFYRAATNWSQDRYLIPHPHTYVHLTQLSFVIFGQSIGSARLIGVLAALLNLVLIPPFVYAFCDRGRQAHWIAVGAIWLYALNPMTVQNMMLLDIDNTLLVPALLGMLLVWKSVQDWTSSRRIAALSLMFAMTLWIRLSTPVLLLGCIGLFHLLRGDIRRTGELILTALAGGILFRATFALYSRLTGFTLDIFNYTFGKAPGGSSDYGTMLLRFPQGVGTFITWLSLPLAALLLVAIASTVVRLIRHRIENRDLLAIYVVATSLFYALVIPPAWGYPRYQAPIVPVITILVAALLVPALQTLPRRARITLVGLGVAAFVYKLTIIGDPLWPLYAVTFVTSTGDLSTRLTQGISVVAKMGIPISTALVVAYLLSLRWKIKPLLVIMCTLGVLSFAHTASTTAIQVTANYSTRYRYTYNYDDLRQTIEDLKEMGGYTLAVKDVLYYTGLPGEEIYEYVCPSCSPQALIDKLHSTRVDALVWTTKEDNRSPNVSQNPAVIQVLNACYTRVTHGVFIVYLRRPNGPCP